MSRVAVLIVKFKNFVKQKLALLNAYSLMDPCDPTALALFRIAFGKLNLIQVLTTW